MRIKKRQWISQNTKEKKSDTLYVGTWNVRGLAGTEVELVIELDRIEMDTLAITEIKKKGKKHIMICNEVPANERAQCGVGCIIKKEHENMFKN